MIDELPKPNRGRRWAIIALVVFLAFGALFFFSRQSFHSRAARLRQGMTRQEVIAVMGQPDRIVKLSNVEFALFTPLPFSLHALIMAPGQVLRGNSGIPATSFPAYVEFKGDVAVRVRVNDREIDAVKK